MYILYNNSIIYYFILFYIIYCYIAKNTEKILFYIIKNYLKKKWKKKNVEYTQIIIKSVLPHFVARKNEFVLNLVDHGFIPFLS